MSAAQLDIARQLLPTWRGQGLPGSLAAAMLVVLEQAAGRELSTIAALEAVQGVGDTARRTVLSIVPELVRHWKVRTCSS